MGLNAVDCKGPAGPGTAGIGKDYAGWNDFGMRDLLLVGVVGLIASAYASAISLNYDKRVQLGWGEERPDKGIDATLDIRQDGDKVAFDGWWPDHEYKTMFTGKDESGKFYFDVSRKEIGEPMETRHIALAEYRRPETIDEAVGQYERLQNGSTDSVALLDFGGNGNDIKVLAFVENGANGPKLNIADGYLNKPDGMNEYLDGQWDKI